MLRSIPGLWPIVLSAIPLALAQGARAHSWYPWECCSDNDCAPIALQETPREERGGFTLADGRHVAYREIKVSPDRQWHLCEQKWPADPAKRKILCVYAPVGGF